MEVKWAEAFQLRAQDCGLAPALGEEDKWQGDREEEVRGEGSRGERTWYHSAGAQGAGPGASIFAARVAGRGLVLLRMGRASKSQHLIDG